MRGVHFNNRISNTSLVRTYQPIYYNTLLNWALANEVSSEKIEYIKKKF